MTEKDDFRRFFESQLKAWEESRDERQSRTIFQMWDDWITGPASKRRKERDGWFRRWLEVRFEVNDRIVSLGQLSYSELTTETLILWIRKVSETCGKRGRPICAGTVEQIRSGVQAMFTYYLNTDQIDRNPLRAESGVPKTPGHDRKRQGYLTRDQVELIVAHMPLVSGYFAKHLYYTGCRFNNIRTLRKDKVDYGASELVLVVKGGKQKRVVVGRKTMEEIRHLSEISPGPFVYPSPYKPTTSAIAVTTLRRHLNAACSHAEVNLPKVAGEKTTYHHFRHGRAREVLERTKDITQVKALLTHSDIRTTMRYLGDDLIRKELHKTIKDD